MAYDYYSVLAFVNIQRESPLFCMMMLLADSLCFEYPSNRIVPFSESNMDEDCLFRYFDREKACTR